MAYAIIAAGGTQLRVQPGRFYDLNRLPVEADEQITIDSVLLVENDGDLSIGQPLVEGATVSGTVLSHLRGKKVIVYKMQPKKKTRKKQGHRQELTRVMIDSITVGGNTITADASSATAPAATSAPDSTSDSADSEEATASTTAS
ncbi:50S ribosomal protein L21 [Leptolyngbya sp. BC1307]|uniref:50S ribosomal protein L21 n=1 Tax=Leptolyngbya sp. BC1307 TaxID=2029589 RepID=UPI000EFAB4A6|nr:50S ribosomal protein L21 [Leptolyngbya sp. BC1307]